jgi:hypothetical protein
MALQNALAKLEEYNAAMALPQAGLLGIGAFLAEPPQTKIAGEEIRAYLETCQLAEEVISNGPEVARRNIRLYCALRQIFPTDEKKEEFREMLRETREVFNLLLKKVSGEAVSNLPTSSRLHELTNQLESLSGKIKEAIPRDAYLASLTGKTYPGFGARRS